MLSNIITAVKPQKASLRGFLSIAISTAFLACTVITHAEEPMYENLLAPEYQAIQVEPLIDVAGVPLTALDWLSYKVDGKLLLEMPATKECTAAQLSRNRLDWYVFPETYDKDVETTIKGIMGYNLLSSTVESNSWRFMRFKGDEPVAMLYHEWDPNPQDFMTEKLFGKPIAATMQAGISAGADIISSIVNMKFSFTNARDESIKLLRWEYNYEDKKPSPYFVRLNVVPDYQTVKRVKTPMHYYPMRPFEASLKKGDDYIDKVNEFAKAGGRYDQYIKRSPNPLGWSSHTYGGDTITDENNIAHIIHRDSIIFIKNIRPLLKLNGMLKEYISQIFNLPFRVDFSLGGRYSNFLATVSSYGDSEELEVGGYKSLISESRIPLPGVSAFSLKPLDLMLIEAFSDPRVPSTRNSKESYPVVEKLIKERLPIYRKRLAEIFAEDQRIADEAGLGRDEGCEYSIADWGDESLASQVGQAEAERLGFVK